MKRHCVICGAPVKGRFDYCRKCFNSKIHELNLQYGQDEESPSEEPGWDRGGASVNGAIPDHIDH